MANFANPFAAPTNPFAAPAGGAAPANPFAAPAGGTAPANPFAVPAGGAAPANPFASPAGGATPANPFAAPAGGTTPANPFAAPAGGAALANPFAAPAGGTTPANPFAAPAGGTTPANPFAAPAGGAPPFSIFGTQPTSAALGMPGVGGAPPVQQAPTIATLGVVGQTIDTFQRSYAAVKAANGKWAAKVEAGAIPNEDCEFKTIVYKKRQGLNQHDALLSGPLLEQAEHHNPDPEHLIPARELGITALQARFDLQQKEAKDCKSHVDHLADIIDTLEVSNSQMATRFEGIKDKQITIYQGLLAVMRKIEVLRAHDSPVQASEIRYRERLNRILAALRGPYMDLQELTSSLAQQERKKDTIADADNEEDLEFLMMSLRKQQEGIEYISEVLTKDARDIGIMKSRLNESRPQQR